MPRRRITSGFQVTYSIHRSVGPVHLLSGSMIKYCDQMLSQFVQRCSLSPVNQIAHGTFSNWRVSIIDVKSAEKRVKVTNLLLHMLPLEYYRITKSLIMLLHSVSMQAEQNKMTPDNLGAVFAPHLLCPKKVQKLCLVLTTVHEVTLIGKYIWSCIPLLINR